MIDHDLFSELADEITKVFSWSIEPHLAHHDPARGLTAGEFYEQIYVGRLGEDKEFLSFLHGGKTILILTGHVGVGKSTFIREKYQNARSCVGITVDLKQRQTAGILIGDLAANLHTVISHAVKDRLIANFRVAVAQGQRHPLFDIGMYSGQVTTSESEPDDQALAELNLASFILMRDDWLKSDALSEVRGKYGADVPSIGIVHKEAKYRENIQRVNTKTALIDIFNAMKYREWLRCYQILFAKSQSLLVVIDNTDVLDTKLAGGKVYEPIVEMEGYLNGWDDAQIAAGFTLPNIKFVFAVRDENIALINTHGRRPNQALQISLGPEDVSIPYVEDRKSLSTSDGFISAVIQKRLSYLATLISNKDNLQEYFAYFRNIIGWWFEENPVGLTNLSDRITQTNIIALNNRSLSQILEHISQASLQMLKTCLWCNISRESFDAESGTIGLRGRILRAAWTMNNIRKLNQHWRSEFNRKVSEPYISLTRLLLTILVNYKTDYPGEGKKVAKLVNELSPYYPNLTSATVKDALYALYESSVGQAELVSIEQADYISCGADIQDDSKVFAMLRGIELLDKILIQIDFFGEMLAFRQAVPPRLGTMKILMEMTPFEAVSYVGGIYKQLIIKMARNYEALWKSVFGPVLKSQIPQGSRTRPFQKFVSNRLTYNGAFYMVRCCDSHRGSIKSYLQQCMKGDRHKLLLDKSESASLLADFNELLNGWTDEQRVIWNQGNPATYHYDEYYMHLLNEGPPHNNLVKLWKISQQYSGVLRMFANLTNY